MSLTPTLPQWASGQAHPDVVVNANFKALQHMAVYANNPDTTELLTWGYLGGRWGGFAVAAGMLTLTASATNYIVVARATGVISTSTATTNWDNADAYVRVYQVTTGASGVTAVEDHRAGEGGIFPANAGGGALAALSDVNLTGVTDGDVLLYDQATSSWVPGATSTPSSGVWTPTLVGATTAGVGTYVSQFGSYEKIGNLVFVRMQLIWTAHTGTGQMYIDGLPFAQSHSNMVFSIALASMTYTNTPLAVGSTAGGGTRIYFYTQSSGAGLAVLNMDTAATIYLTGCYSTT